LNVSSRKNHSKPQNQRWEVGGEFHWCEWPQGPYIPWPEPAVWYALGRYAVAALLRMTRPRPRLWIPDYFCHDVVEHWRGLCRPLMYRDDPRWPEPNWQSLRVRPGDWVLAMNYFGIRHQDPWKSWKERENVCLLEDHSHDPVSEWARSSDADYAFASLRKTLPVPDGGLLWSPRHRKLPAMPKQEAPSRAASLKLSAMLLKSEYLAGRASVGVKVEYRRLQKQGEDCFVIGEVTAISPVSRELLRSGVPQIWCRRRRANATQLLRGLHAWSVAEAVTTKGIAETPLAMVLCFGSKEARDKCRKYLESKDVYCPIHWPMPPSAGWAARQLSGRLLSIPIDHRYKPSDVRMITKSLTKFVPKGQSFSGVRK